MFVEEVSFKRYEILLVLDLMRLGYRRRAVCALRANRACDLTDVAVFFFVNGVVKMFRRSDARQAQQEAECQNV